MTTTTLTFVGQADPDWLGQRQAEAANAAGPQSIVLDSPAVAPLRDPTGVVDQVVTITGADSAVVVIVWTDETDAGFAAYLGDQAVASGLTPGAGVVDADAVAAVYRPEVPMNEPTTSGVPCRLVRKK